MFRIGEFSKLGKTTVKALRYYDEIGLLKPQEIDEFTKYRFYTTEQLITLHEIQALKQLGLSIEEIKLIISNKNTKALLEKRKAELISQIAREQDQLSRIEFILLNEGEVISMKYQGIIKELPECIVYSKKMVVPNYDAYFQTIPSIG
ncbi:MAG: helix-turn-helix domain-containing protein, partial [Clostridiaceae bacterium]